VFAAANEKKQEKLLHDCCYSITVMHTGTASGPTGPNNFLLKGMNCCNNFNNEYFLLRYGMATGSIILMTESAYMTDAAWLGVSKAIVQGYHQLLFMKENENWFIAKLLDGFKSHKNVLQAHKICADQLIISLKEESNSSHVNQGYNQLTAKNSKKNAAESLYDKRRVRKWQTGKSHIDQYNLVLTAMRTVRATTESTWVSSFQHVNLHPQTPVLFQSFARKLLDFFGQAKFQGQKCQSNCQREIHVATVTLACNAAVRQEGCDDNSAESWFQLHCRMSSDALF
jgi:hypothetical protein